MKIKWKENRKYGILWIAIHSNIYHYGNATSESKSALINFVEKGIMSDKIKIV